MNTCSFFVSPRFRSQADAEEFLDCYKNDKKFPPWKHIHPFVMRGNHAVWNPEYRDAPFEVRDLVLQKP